MNWERRYRVLDGSKTVVAGALWLAVAACDKTPPAPPAAPLPAKSAGEATSAISSATGGSQTQAPPVNAKAKQDEVLAARVKAALSAHSRLRTFAIDVRASGGTVELFGTVDSKLTRDQVAELVSSVEGVGSVTNHVVLVSGS